MSARPAFVVAAFVVALAATSARAAGPEGPVPTVAILRPASDDPVLVEAATRLGLELGASGSTSALVDGGGDFPTRVALVRDEGVVTIDVLAQLAGGQTVHRRVSVPRADGGDDPAVIAVRAVELLRGIRLDVRRTPPAATVRAPEELEPADAHASEQGGWRLAAGLGVLSARPLATALAPGPVLVAVAPLGDHLSFVALLAGPFSTSRPPTPDGSASTTEELGGVGLRVETHRPRWNAHAFVAAGLHHLSATFDERGEAPDPREGFHVFTPQSVWTPVLVAAAGASARLWRSGGASLELVAVIAQPALELLANERVLGTIGAPSWLPVASGWIEFP